MGRIREKRPSPAMVVAIVSLVFAVGGTAVAGVATISVLSKKEKKQTRNIAKDEIKKAAPSLQVARAQNAGNADTLGGVGPGGFLPSSGSFQVQISSDEWETQTATSSVEPRTGQAQLSGSMTDEFFNAPLSIPSVVQGRATQINSIVLCYQVQASATLDRVFLWQTTATTGVFNSRDIPIDDETDRTDDTCRTYTGTGGSIPVGPNDMLQLIIRADYAAASYIAVSRLTVNMST
jgi:hypothetical protein